MYPLCHSLHGALENLVHGRIFSDLDPPHDALICLYRRLQSRSYELGDGKQMVVDAILAHDFLNTQDSVGAEWLCEQMFEIVEVVVHVHFGGVEVYADDQDLGAVPLGER